MFAISSECVNKQETNKAFSCVCSQTSYRNKNQQHRPPKTTRAVFPRVADVDGTFLQTCVPSGREYRTQRRTRTLVLNRRGPMVASAVPSAASGYLNELLILSLQSDDHRELLWFRTKRGCNAKQCPCFCNKTTTLDFGALRYLVILTESKPTEQNRLKANVDVAKHVCSHLQVKHESGASCWVILQQELLQLKTRDRLSVANTFCAEAHSFCRRICFQTHTHTHTSSRPCGDRIGPAISNQLSPEASATLSEYKQLSENKDE